jgi:hypothetical protein
MTARRMFLVGRRRVRPRRAAFLVGRRTWGGATVMVVREAPGPVRGPFRLRAVVAGR